MDISQECTRRDWVRSHSVCKKLNLCGFGGYLKEMDVKEEEIEERPIFRNKTVGLKNIS